MESRLVGAPRAASLLWKGRQSVSRLLDVHGARAADQGLALGKGNAGFSTLFPSGSKIRVKVQTKDSHRSVCPPTYTLSLGKGKRQATDLGATAS